MLNPSLLLFLPLALLPVILHLITLHRLRTVELPTFRFLMDGYLQQRRRARLLEWLLLLLRTAFVALVVFTLSRPVVESSAWFGGARGGRDLVLIIDSGASMALRSAGTSSMERARAAARALVELTSAEDRVTVIAAGRQPRTVLSRFANDPQGIVDTLNALEPTAASANLATAMQQALGDASRRGRMVYIITDGNKAAWSTLQRQPVAELVRGTMSQVAVLDVGPREPVSNLAVLGDAPAVSSAVAGLPVLLQARVANQSTQPADTVLSVIVDDQTVAQHNLSLQPGQVLDFPLALTPSKPGIAQVRLQLPSDAFPDDDAYLLALNVERKLAGLIMHPKPAAGQKQDDTLYLRAALKQTDSLSVRALEAGQVDANALADADMVIVADVDMTENLGKLLRTYVSGGGGLLVFPGPGVQPRNYQQFLLTPKGAEPLPLKLLEPVGDVDDEAGFLPPTSIDLDHPVLSVFADRSVSYFTTTRLFRWFPMEVASGAQPQVRVLMRLPDRTPLLAEAALGSGRVMLAAFPATPQWSNLPLKPEFVPMVLRGVSWLGRRPPVQGPSVVTPGEPAVVTLQEDWADAHVEAADPDGRWHPVEMHRDQGRRVGAMLQTQAKGFYRFRVEPGDKKSPERTVGFAVNLDLDGEHLSMLNQEAMRELLGVEAQVVRGTAQDPTLASQLGSRRELWRTMIWFAFAVVAVEFLLSTLRPRTRRIGVEATALAAARQPSWFDRIHSLTGQRWASGTRDAGAPGPGRTRP